MEIVKDESIYPGYGLWKWRSMYFRRLLLLMLADIFGLLLWSYLYQTEQTAEVGFIHKIPESGYNPWGSINAVIPLAVSMHIWGILGVLLPEWLLPSQNSSNHYFQFALFFSVSVLIALIISARFFESKEISDKMSLVLAVALSSCGFLFLHHLGCLQISSWLLFLGESGFFCVCFVLSGRIHFSVLAEALLSIAILVLAAHFQDAEWIALYAESLSQGNKQRLPAGVSLTVNASEFLQLMTKSLHTNSALLATYYTALLTFDGSRQGGVGSTHGTGGEQASAAGDMVHGLDPQRAVIYRGALEEVLMLLRHTRMVTLALFLSGMAVDEHHQVLLDGQSDAFGQLEMGEVDQHVSQVALLASCWQICHLIESSQGTALPIYVCGHGTMDGVLISRFRIHVAVESILFLILYELITSAGGNSCICHVSFQADTVWAVDEGGGRGSETPCGCSVVVTQVAEATASRGKRVQLGPLTKLANRIAYTHLGTTITVAESAVDKNSPTSASASDSWFGPQSGSLKRLFWARVLESAEESMGSAAIGNETRKRLTKTQYSFKIPAAFLTFPPPAHVSGESNASSDTSINSPAPFMHTIPHPGELQPTTSNSFPDDVYFRSVDGKANRRTCAPTADRLALVYPWVFLEEDEIVDQPREGQMDTKNKVISLPGRATNYVDENLYQGIKNKLRNLMVPHLSCKLSDLLKILTTNSSRTGGQAARKAVPGARDYFCDGVGRVVLLKPAIATMPAAPYLLTELAKIIDVKTVFVLSGLSGEILTQSIEEVYNFPVDHVVSANVSTYGLCKLVQSISCELPPRSMRETVVACEFPIESLFESTDQNETVYSNRVTASGTKSPTALAIDSSGGGLNMQIVANKLRDLGFTGANSNEQSARRVGLIGVSERSRLLSRYRHDVDGSAVSSFHVVDSVQINSQDLPWKLQHCFQLAAKLNEFLNHPEVVESCKHTPLNSDTARSSGHANTGSSNGADSSVSKCFVDLANYSTIFLHLCGTEDIFVDGMFAPSAKEKNRTLEKKAKLVVKDEKKKYRTLDMSGDDEVRWKHRFVLMIVSGIRAVRMLLEMDAKALEQETALESELMTLKQMFKKQNFLLLCLMVDVVKSLSACRLKIRTHRAKLSFGTDNSAINSNSPARGADGSDSSEKTNTASVGCANDCTTAATTVNTGDANTTDSIQTATAMMHHTTNTVEAHFWEQLSADGQKKA